MSEGKRGPVLLCAGVVFHAYVLFLYGPMFAIYILSFQGPEAG